MYTLKNFQTKKAAREALAEALAAGKPGLRFYQPGPFGGNEPTEGRITLEGPHYPEPHRWYGSAQVRDGFIVSIK